MLLAIINFLFVCLFVCSIYFLKIPVTEMLERNMQLQRGQTNSQPVHNAAIDGFIEQWLSFDCAGSRLTAVCTFNMQSDSFVNNAFHHVSVLENVSMLA